MLKEFKQNWRQFEAASPGNRFQQRFEKQQQSRQSAWRKALFIGGGILIMAVGCFFLITPGPGLVIIFVGAGLIAQQSLFAARALDWIELRVRKLAGWSVDRWRRAPLAAKFVLALLVTAVAGTLAYAAYRLLFAY